MEPEKVFDLLSKIERVDAPYFLLTRINQQIQNESLDKASSNWVIRIAFAMLVLVALNIGLVLSQAPSQSATNHGEALIEQLELSTSNELY